MLIQEDRSIKTEVLVFSIFMGHSICFMCMVVLIGGVSIT